MFKFDRTGTRTKDKLKTDAYLIHKTLKDHFAHLAVKMNVSTAKAQQNRHTPQVTCMHATTLFSDVRTCVD